MEEEIITPEEEIFEYNKLRYILDKNGYVCHASLGGLVVCDLGECTEYNGEVPSDYETIEEWYDGELEKLNAWKIVKGNLVFDANKYNELQAKYEIEAEENATATHKYVNDKVNGISVSNSKDLRGLFDKATAKDFKVIKLDDTSDFTTDKITIDTTTKENKIDLVISNSNMLISELVSTSKDGIKFNVSMDKQIEISGTSTENIEIDLTKDSTNTIPFLLFKKNFDYCLSGLNGINLKMYYYDGTNRTEIYSGTDGLIKFTDSDKPVTHITLSIPVNTKIKQTIAPMINLGTTALKYEKAETVYKLIDFPDYPKVVVSESLIAGEDTIVSYCGNIQVILDNGVLKVIDEYEKEIEEIEMPSTFYPISTIYTMQDTVMSIDYISSQSNGVPYDEVIKAINDSPETIKISADKLDIDAVATFTNSKLAKAGSTTINGSNITTGSINASLITTGTLNADRVNGGTISGSSINLGNGTFSVNTSGVANCSNINATGGSIAGWLLDNSRMYNNSVAGSYCGINAYGQGKAFWAGGSDLTGGNAPFNVGHDGILTATNVNISGTISGSTITGSTFTAGSININDGVHYFSMGYGTSHPRCSGLNVDGSTVLSNGVFIGGEVQVDGYANSPSDLFYVKGYGDYDYQLRFAHGILVSVARV